MDTDIFFPSPGPTMHQQIAEAKAICAQCPVRTDCLDYAVGFIVGNFITLPGKAQAMEAHPTNHRRNRWT